MKQFPNQQNIRCNLSLETSRNFFKIFDSYHRYFFINSQVKRANETPLFRVKLELYALSYIRVVSALIIL